MEDPQIRSWSIQPSFAFIEQPQTNAVAETFDRTLKEQAVYGRVFRNADEVRVAVADFVARSKTHCRLEKLAYLSPAEARAALTQPRAAWTIACPRGRARNTSLHSGKQVHRNSHPF